MSKRDYYEVLGVQREATAQEIRAAYRRLARRYCPDVNLWDERAGALFAEIEEAYRVLRDASTRALYDRLGHRAFAPESTAAADAPRGDDLHYPVEIGLEEALRGVNAVLELVRQEPCPACGASDGATGPPPCPRCGGRPARVVAHGGLPVTVHCEACRGTGVRPPERCGTCGGRGTVARRTRLTVAIPAGVDTGSQIRIPGAGHAAPPPGRRGDLVVITRVRPHPFFTRKGDNLHCEVPVTVPEAALGARIEVPTPDGAVVLTLPAGTQNGQVFRIRGRGCPRLDRDGRGDLFVTVRVAIPRNADSTLEEVLRALQRLWPEDPRAELWSWRGGER